MRRSVGAPGAFGVLALGAIVGACTAFSSSTDPSPGPADAGAAEVEDGGADGGALSGVRCGAGRCASNEVCCGKQGDPQFCTSRGECVGTYAFECESAPDCAGRIGDRSARCCALVSGGALYAGSSCATRCASVEVCDLSTDGTCPSGLRCLPAEWPPGYGYCSQ